MRTDVYLNRQKVLQNRLMKRHLKPVYDALQYQVDQTISKVNSDGIDEAYKATFHELYINPKIGPAVSALWEDAGRQAASRLRIQKSIVIPLLGFVKDVIDYFNHFLLMKVVLPISRTTVRDIQKILKQAISDGWGVDKTVRELRNSEITKWRAKMIVRTESVAAMNYAQLKAADDKNYEVEKTWLATEDTRTRYTHGHAGVDGEKRGLFESFSNGLLFPGDPNGPAGEVINCRCTLIYNVKRDENGNPVRKPQPAQLVTA